MPKKKIRFNSLLAPSLYAIYPQAIVIGFVGALPDQPQPVESRAVQQ